MWLTLDIGNSAAKGGLFDGTALQEVFHVDHDGLDAEAWQRTFRTTLGDRSLERIGVASVVPKAASAASEALVQLTGCVPEPIHPAMHLPFRLGYETPDTLGVDRLAAAAAAWVRYGQAQAGRRARSVVAIDAGTAVTLDVVTRDGVYAGGTIGPGPELLARALRDGTAQLPEVPLALPDRLVGRSTEEAMQSGIMYGFVESTRGLLARIGAALGDAPAVVATGGWSTLLAEEIDAIADVAPHLVLDGIRTLMGINAP